MYGPINTQSLLNFFIDQILAVLQEVKHKLIYKAIDRYNLLNGHMRADSDGAPNGPVEKLASAPGAPEEEKIAEPELEYIKEYPECPMAFD